MWSNPRLIIYKSGRRSNQSIDTHKKNKSSQQYKRETQDKKKQDNSFGPWIIYCCSCLWVTAALLPKRFLSFYRNEFWDGWRSSEWKTKCKQLPKQLILAGLDQVPRPSRVQSGISSQTSLFRQSTGTSRWLHSRFRNTTEAVSSPGLQLKPWWLTWVVMASKHACRH